MHPPFPALAAIVGWALARQRADTPSPRCDPRPGQEGGAAGVLGGGSGFRGGGLLAAQAAG